MNTGHPVVHEGRDRPASLERGVERRADSVAAHPEPDSDGASRHDNEAGSDETLTAAPTLPDELVGVDEIVSISDAVDGIAVHVAGTGQPVELQTVADAPVRFKIRLANNDGNRSSVSYLIEKMYAWRGYAASGPRPAPNRVTLMASDAARTLATISVGFDSDEGLVVEDLYSEEVKELRLRGARLCEFTKLAVDRHGQSMDVLAMMFHVAYMYARRIHSCTDLVIEVNPRHVRFYERMLGFRSCGEPRMCPRVGAPAVLMCLDLVYAQEQIARYGGKRTLAGTVRALYPLFFSQAEEDGIVGRLRAIG